MSSKEENRGSLIVLIPLVERIQNQFDAARDSQLIEDPVQVVSDGMLGILQSLGNFAVLHAIGNSSDLTADNHYAPRPYLVWFPGVAACSQRQAQGMSLAPIPSFEQWSLACNQKLLPGCDHWHNLYLVCFGEHFAFSAGGRCVDQGDATRRQIEGADHTVVPMNHDK